MGTAGSASGRDAADSHLGFLHAKLCRRPQQLKVLESPELRVSPREGAPDDEWDLFLRQFRFGDSVAVKHLGRHRHKRLRTAIELLGPQSEDARQLVAGQKGQSGVALVDNVPVPVPSLVIFKP